MAGLAVTASTPMWGKCPDCAHVWVVAYYPQTLEKFAKLMKAHSACPKCAGRGVLAKQEDGELLEPCAQRLERSPAGETLTCDRPMFHGAHGVRHSGLDSYNRRWDWEVK